MSTASRITILAVTILLTAVGCGGDGAEVPGVDPVPTNAPTGLPDVTSPVPTNAPTGLPDVTSPMQTPPPSIASPPSAPPPNEERAPVDTTNRNDTSQPLGALCWARQNIGNALNVELASLVAGDKIDAERLTKAFTSSQTELRKATPALPAEVTAFTARFDADLSKNIARPPATAEELAWAFDFEAYPAADIYIELATAGSACTGL